MSARKGSLKKMYPIWWTEKNRWETDEEKAEVLSAFASVINVNLFCGSQVKAQMTGKEEALYPSFFYFFLKKVEKRGLGNY